MKLHDIVEAYIDYKRSLGMRFRSQAAVLRAFNRAMGDIAIAEVKPEAVLAFIAGTGPITARWIENHRVLGGFYHYAVGRGFATISPLPTDTPRPPTRLTPYIYTVDELKRLLAATEILQTPLSPLLALTMRTLFLLLYGTGMRIGEALSLTLQDADLENRLLTVRDSKFFKTRLVPIGPRLTTVLTDYLSDRCQLPLLASEASAFLATRTGLRLDYKRVSKLFCRIRQSAEIRRRGHCAIPASHPRYSTLRSRSSSDRVVSRRRRRPTAAAAVGDLSWACRHRLHPTLPNNDRGTAE